MLLLDIIRNGINVRLLFGFALAELTVIQGPYFGRTVSLVCHAFPNPLYEVPELHHR